LGYTHHWYRSVLLPPESWGEFLDDARRLVDAAGVRGVPLAGPAAEAGSLPVLTADEVALNGVGADSCESFAIPRVFENPGRLNEAGLVHDFCKTRHRPYDLAVTAILIAAKRRFGDVFTVTSDGDDPEWADGRELCRTVLGFGSEYAIIDRWLVRRPEAPAPRARPDPIVIREFPALSDGRYRIRVVRSSANSRASVILDLREFARGVSFEGYTRRGIRIASLADVRRLREALEVIERESLLRE